MAKSNSGKWVSRVGAGGGGKAYRKTRPMNYYGAITLIVVLGLLSVVYSRYEYQNPASAEAPAIGTTWFAAFNGEACGNPMPTLVPDAATATNGLTVTQKNVLVISPKVAEEAGRNATLATFMNQHPSLSYANKTVKFPVPTEWISSPSEYKDGSKCPKGTKYAGQVGHFGIAYWSQFGQKDPVITTDPASVKFTDLMRITFYFAPDGVKPGEPSTETLAYMVQLQQSTNGSGTTTTIPGYGVTSTTMVNIPTTTAPATTIVPLTTVPPSSTTTTVK